MTREEAMQWLKVERKVRAINGECQITEALDMAIEALSADSDCNNCNEYGSYKCTRCDGEIYHKTDGDLISRETIENTLVVAQEMDDITLDEYNKFLSVLDKVPSAELTLQTPQTYGKSINPSNAEVVADLISRADAIEAVHDACNYCDTCDLKDIGCSQINALSALPSADAVSREDYHNLLTASKDIDRALREYQAKEEQTSADAVNREIIKDILKIIPTAYLLEALGVATFEELMESAEAVHKPDYSYEADMVRRLKESLSAEAVQGEWGHMIADGSDGSHWYEYECSHCGEVVLRPYNFCPNCGANMKGGEDE